MKNFRPTGEAYIALFLFILQHTQYAMIDTPVEWLYERRKNDAADCGGLLRYLP